MVAQVLIAEDDVLVGRAIQQFFRKRGVPVALATTLAEGRRLLETDSVWMGAIIDVGLPDGTGMTLLDAFRQRWWAEPALVLTGQLDATLINRAQQAGAEYALKPLDLGSLDAFAVRLRITESDSPLGRACAVLAQRHGLTVSEARIVALSAAGVSRDELPGHLGTSENTVKTQIRAVLRKCGQTELGGVVRQVWRQVAQGAG